jgi:hypothetical protein
MKEDKMGRAHNTNGEKRGAYGSFMGKPGRRRPLGTPRSKCVDNIKLDL